MEICSECGADITATNLPIWKSMGYSDDYYAPKGCVECYDPTPMYSES